MRKHIAIRLLIGWMALILSCSPIPRNLFPPPEAAETPAATGTPTGVSLPAPSLFETTWHDRTPWQAGLVPATAGALESLPAIPVYHILVTIADDLLHLDGRQEVLYTNLEETPLDEVVFHLYPNLFGGRLEVTNTRLDGAPAQADLDAGDTLLRLPLSPALAPGEAVVISLDFEVSVPSEGNSNYNTFSYSEGVLALAQFYPLLAVYEAPAGWDTESPPAHGDVLYADASLYRVQITAPASLVIVSSGLVTGQEVQDGRQVQTIAAGPVREFYVAARPGYEKISRQAGQTTVNSYAPPGFEEGSQKSLDAAVHALESFNDLVGPYPFSELDLAATATSALGVEYPGVAVITGRIYNGGEQAGSPLAAAFLESTVVHETAHQWFYGVIGNDQVRQPWLDESMAQYATAYYFQDRYGAQAAGQYRQDWLQRWESIDRQAIPIGLPVADYPVREYSAIIYGRGPLFLEELEKRMGEETFRAFLQEYYLTYRWEIATTAAFEDLAEGACGCSLAPLFEEWVYP